MSEAADGSQSGARRALLIGVAGFDDPALAQLRSPRSDVAGLAGVLGDSRIGQFDVTTCLDEPSGGLRERLDVFLGDSRPQDLLLLYFSGHGLKDEDGRLYLAAVDTKIRALQSTGIDATFVSELMDRARARRIVLILECCYGGAFPAGRVAKSSPTVDVLHQLGGHGRGRVVLTASNSFQYAFEGDQISAGDVPGSFESIFTGALIQGLRTGDADLNGDGLIDVDELYSFAYEVVRGTTTSQTPQRTSLGVEGSIVIARSVKGARISRSETPDVVEQSASPPVEGLPSELPNTTTAADAFRINARAVSDLPSAVDHLNVTPVVAGLAALLDDEATTLPLTVAIAAAWGGGKSSTMLQLRQRLCGSSRLKGVRRSWIAVDFPAWRYENTERLWAALAKCVYAQAQNDMGWRQRLLFRMRLERRRQGLP